MSKLPRITAREFISVLGHLGFIESRRAGGHKIFKNFVGLRVTVSIHSTKTIHPKIIRTFLRDNQMSVEEFIDCL